MRNLIINKFCIFSEFLVPIKKKLGMGSLEEFLKHRPAGHGKIEILVCLNARVTQPRTWPQYHNL